MSGTRVRGSFEIAASPRYRASSRRDITAAGRQGMVLAIGVALLGCLWHIPFHPGAAGLIVALNAAVAAAALLCLGALSTVARRRPEVVIFVMLVAVEAATIALGLGHAPLAVVAVGYLLMLPVVVSLFIPWATKVHVTWLAGQAALAIGYALFAPTASIPDGARDQLIGLIVVAVAVSQSGHIVRLQARVAGFSQIQQITALNRQARRDQARLDTLNEVLEVSAATDPPDGSREPSGARRGPSGCPFEDPAAREQLRPADPRPGSLQGDQRRAWSPRG